MHFCSAFGLAGLARLVFSYKS